MEWIAVTVGICAFALFTAHQQKLLADVAKRRMELEAEERRRNRS